MKNPEWKLFSRVAFEIDLKDVPAEVLKALMIKAGEERCSLGEMVARILDEAAAKVLNDAPPTPEPKEAA